MLVLGEVLVDVEDEEPVRSTTECLLVGVDLNIVGEVARLDSAARGSTRNSSMPTLWKMSMCSRK
eukprot:1121123-Amphidinium_carterae.1